MNNELMAYVYNVERLTPNIVEVVVHAPAAARGFNPGQFYRLQNYEVNADTVTDSRNNKTILAMEGLALTGAWVDKEKGLLSTIVLEMGGSSDLCFHLKKDEPIVLMGPTGSPTETPGGETVMLVGGGLGNAVLFSIGKAFKASGSKVLYFAGYKKAQDRYKIKDIEEASDVIVWACDEAIFTPEREHDKSFHGNIVEAIKAYGSGMLGKSEISLKNVDRVIAIGSHRMMEAVGKARHTVLKDMLKKDHEAVGSINSPMQCMMKEICAQCLQKHIDPKTGKEIYVYSCFNQDQDLDKVCFDHLDQRLAQNGIQEKLTALWIKRSLKQLSCSS
jgi:NAD(P)H-flavin reductase